MYKRWKRFLNKLAFFIRNPRRIVPGLGRNEFLNWLPDRFYLRLLYFTTVGKRLDLASPRTFNEKIQWLKLYNRNPRYTMMVDKYAVKQYVAQRIGTRYIIPTLGVWDRVEDVDLRGLGERFVLKCTHDSGSAIRCKDRTSFDWIEAKRHLQKCMRRNYYWSKREWPYKNVKPRIIAEPYLVDESGVELKDYKFFCFNGEPKLIQVDYDRFRDHKRNLYTTDWEYIPAMIQYPTDPTHEIPKPAALDEMLRIAANLSEGMPHVRVDLYQCNGQVYFGELTFHHGGGMEHFDPESLAYQMGDWIVLPSRA